MEKLKNILAFLAFLKTFQGKESLICPCGYKATGQSWYAELPNNPKYVRYHYDSDFTLLLKMHELAYHPKTFSVCVTRTSLTGSPHIELCIEWIHYKKSLSTKWKKSGWSGN